MAFEPDVADLVRRRHRLDRRRRVVAGIAGLVLTAAGIGAAALVLDVGRRADEVPRQSTTLPAGTIELSPGDVPEGRLVVQAGSSLEALDAGADESAVVSTGFFGDDVSPDGSHVVVAPNEPNGEAIVVIDLPTGEDRTVARADPDDLYAQPQWSPDSRSIAFVGNDGSAREILCIVAVESRDQRCFPDSGRVYSLDWTPDGRNIVVAGPPDQSVRLVSVENGDTVAVTAQGGDTPINRAIEEAGLGRGEQLVGPVWSPSGRYLVALASLEGSRFLYLPVVFTPDGEPIALGQASSEFPEPFAWSPVADVLAYTEGTAPYDITEVRILDPVMGEDRSILAGEPRDPQITDLAWSPSGRWLAVARWDWPKGIPELQEIRILSVEANEEPRAIDVDFGDVTEPLIGWRVSPS